jgi:hypothetical protein
MCLNQRDDVSVPDRDKTLFPCLGAFEIVSEPTRPLFNRQMGLFPGSQRYRHMKLITRLHPFPKLLYSLSRIEKTGAKMPHVLF